MGYNHTEITDAAMITEEMKTFYTNVTKSKENLDLTLWIQHSFEELPQINRRRRGEAKWRIDLTGSLNSAEEQEEQQKPRDRWIQR